MENIVSVEPLATTFWFIEQVVKERPTTNPKEQTLISLPDANFKREGNGPGD